MPGEHETFLDQLRDVIGPDLDIEIARKAKIQGKVVLQAVIKKDGSVGDIQVLQSPGAKFGFDEQAIAAVRQWKYKPGLQNGKPVDVYFTVVVTFELN